MFDLAEKRAEIGCFRIIEAGAVRKTTPDAVEGKTVFDARGAIDDLLRPRLGIEFSELVGVLEHAAVVVFDEAFGKSAFGDHTSWLSSSMWK